MRFAIADLDLPLCNQGFSPDSFDVVIGVNVLHAVKSLSFSLKEIFSLLKPNGCLIIAEGSPPDHLRRWRPDVVFGFLRGWWDVSTETPWRPSPGFLMPSQWKDALLACGFDPVYLLPGEDRFRGPCRGGAVLAQKPSGPGRS
jgi:SAM-dependent methyltransferase